MVPEREADSTQYSIKTALLQIFALCLGVEGIGAVEMPFLWHPL